MAALSAEQKQQHAQKVGAFIQNLMKEGKLKGAQPLEQEGVKVSGSKGSLMDGPFNETKEVISGYYHLLARDLAEATAKADPRFEDGAWKIEGRAAAVLAVLLSCLLSVCLLLWIIDHGYCLAAVLIFLPPGIRISDLFLPA